MASSKNPLPPPFAPSRPSTRLKNKDAHPGAIDKPKPCRTPAEMQTIREQQTLNKQEKERNQEEAMKKAAEIEDKQHQEDLKRSAELNVHKPPVASFCLPAPAAEKEVDDEIGSAHSKYSALHMSMWHFWIKKNLSHCFLGPVRATRSEKIVLDGIESDDSDKDQYRPDPADLIQEVSDDDEVEEEDEHENEKKLVASKKGKKAKLGRCEIAAIRTTVPTTGTKSALEHSKRRERSSRWITFNLCI